MNEVYVRWYNNVLQGSIVNEHDLFGMMAVSIPIQGVQAIALFHPSHVYKTAQDACGSYPVHFPTPAEIVHPEPSVRLTEVAVWPASLRSVPEASAPGSNDYAALQQFKADHWDHAHNRLHLDYWPEFLRLWNAYHRKRLGMSEPAEHPAQPQQPEPQPQRKHYTVTELSLFE